MGFYIWYVNSGVLETYYTGNPATCVLNAASFRDSKGNVRHSRPCLLLACVTSRELIPRR